jgi:hypothetical protein
MRRSLVPLTLAVVFLSAACAEPDAIGLNRSQLPPIMRPLCCTKQTIDFAMPTSAVDPYVWTGRASQEAFGDDEVGLALMYPASVWSFGSGP